MEKIKTRTGKYNFGTYGWLMVAFAFIEYYNYVGITGDGMNLLLSGFESTKGFDMVTLLAINTPVSLVAILGTIFFGWVLGRRGIKFTAGITYILSGVLIILWAHTNTIPLYIVVLTLIMAITTGYSHLTAAPLINNWFVNKRQMAFGISSIGLNVCTCLINPMLSLLFRWFGFVNGLSVYGGIVILLGVVTFFWVKETPESIGKYIDNDKESHAALIKQREALANIPTKWTMKKCLKCKEVWLLGIITGLLWFAIMGFVTQIVTHLMKSGFPQGTSIMIMSIAALFGCVSSWVWGLLDEKVGAQKAMIIYSLYFIIPFTLLCIPGSKVVSVIGAICCGWTIGGHSTLMPSYIQAVFGKDEFALPYRCALTMNMVLKAFAFVFLAISLNWIGSYSLAYAFFGVMCIVAAFLCKFVPDSKRIYAGDIPD